MLIVLNSKIISTMKRDQKSRLALDLLEKELELVPAEIGSKLMGGCDMDSMVNSTGFYCPMTGTTYSSGGYGSSDSGYYSNGGYSGGYWSEVNGEHVYTYDGGTLPTVTVYGSGSNDLNTALTTMLTVMGVSADHANIGKILLGLESKGIAWTSAGFGLFGAVLNGAEFYQTGDFEDLGQAALGTYLVVGGLGPLGLAIGGATLFGWEIYEMVRDNQ